MKRLGQWLILAILLVVAALAIAFFVANRQVVTVHFDPFAANAAQQLDFEMPLFLILIAALAIGVVIGSLFTWFGQGKHRRALRVARGDMARLRSDVERMKS